MDNVEDITDDLATLPGYMRRNLLLMRELDLQATSLFAEAAKNETLLITAAADMEASKSNDVTSETQNESGKWSSRTRSSIDDATSPSKKTRKQRNSDTATSKRGSKKEEAKTKHIPSQEEFDKEVARIQEIRMRGMNIIEEKLAVNNQITCMLMHEYENLKTIFDNMYRELESSGQITEELRNYFASDKLKHQSSINSLLSVDDVGEGIGDSKGAAQNQRDIAAIFDSGSNRLSKWNVDDPSYERDSGGEDDPAPSLVSNDGRSFL